MLVKILNLLLWVIGLSLSQELGISQSGTPFSNTSSFTACQYCIVWAQGEITNFVAATPLSAAYITEIIDIASNGTTTSTITDQNASVSFSSFLISLSNSINSRVFPGIATIVSETSIDPTITADFFISYAEYATLTSVNGSQICSTIYSTPLSEKYYTLSESIPASLSSVAIGSLLNGNIPFVPDSFLSSLGLPSPCSVNVNGAPVAQIPVQYLTVISTSNGLAHTQADVTSASPGPTVQPPSPTPTTQSKVVLSPGPGGAPGRLQSPPVPQQTPDQQLNSNPTLDASPSPTVGIANPYNTAVTLGGVPFAISDYSIFVGSQAIFPGGSPVTYQGTPVSLAPSGTAVVIGASTIELLPSSRATAGIVGVSTIPLLGPEGLNSESTPALITLGSSVYTENSASAFVIGSQTLTPGGAITVSGTVISLSSSATAVVINDPAGGDSLLTLESSVYTANSASDFVVGSQTLTPGGSITVSGTVISLASDGAEVVIGSSTEMLEGEPTATSVEIGGIIYSALGGGAGSGSESGGAATTGTVGPGFAVGTGSISRREPGWLRMLGNSLLMLGIGWLI